MSKFDPIATGKKIAKLVTAAEKTREKCLEHAKAAGALLVDVANNHKQHLEAICKRIKLGRSRMNELMKIAGGRKTAEQVKAATKERVAKHRDKKKALPKPKPSVTDDVTDSAAAAADDGRHFYNDPDKGPVTREEFDAAIKAMTEAELIASIKANLAAAEAENAKAQEYLLSAFTRTIDLARSPDDRGDARQGGSTLSRGCRSAMCGVAGIGGSSMSTNREALH